jgi:hypothetical protein
MPHQEFYLAALDQQAGNAIADLSVLMQEPIQPVDLTAKLTAEYLDKEFYAFSRNPDGTLDKTATVFPAVAWWDGTLKLPQAEAMLQRWASAEFSTDWGLRDVSRNAPIYDPISYHQGSVWPLYTGWTAVAEYRAGRPFAGFAHLMQNADMTFTQDLGAVTELLSGDFFQPFGRSSSHQLWSSAMVLTPAIRGLFGVEVDALRHAIRLHPQLPAAWEHAELRHVSVGEEMFDLTYRKRGGRMLVDASSNEPQLLCLTDGAECKPTRDRTHHFEQDLPPFEVELPHRLPEAGAQTTFAKIIGTTGDSIEIEGLGGRTASLSVRFTKQPSRVAGATLADGVLSVRFADGSGYQRGSIRFFWP